MCSASISLRITKTLPEIGVKLTESDAGYIETLIKDGVLSGPVLELGAGYGGATCRELIANSGLEYYATDMVASEGVAYVADFSNPANIADVFGSNQFGCVLVLNVLEHTFSPITILDCALSLVRSGGKLVVITPAIWTLHNFPIDCYRLLPNWYEQFAVTRRCDLLPQYFNYVGYGRVNNYIDQDGNYQFPSPAADSKFKYWRSRVIQKIFNTYGRGMAFSSHVAIGAVYRK